MQVLTVSVQPANRPAPIMLEIVTYYFLEFPKIFTYYSFVLSLLFQNYSQKIHLYYLFIYLLRLYSTNAEGL